MRIILVPVLLGLSWILGESAVAQEASDNSPLKTVVIPARVHVGDNAEAVAFSQDGKLVAAAFGGPSNARFPLEPRGGGIAIWETASGERRHFIGEYGDILKLEFSADGKSLAYARVYTPGDSVDDDVVVVVDVATGKPRHRWSRFQNGPAFVMSKSASQIVVGRDAYDLADFTLLKSLDSLPPRCLAASADGHHVAAIHSVAVPVLRPDGTVNPQVRSLVMKGLTKFDATTFEMQRRMESNELANCFAIAIAPDGKTIVTGHNGGVARIWAGDSLVEVHRIETGFRGHFLPFFAPDGRTLALATQPTNGLHWTYDRTETSGFDIRRDPPSAGCELTFHETTTWKETARWQFEDAAYSTHYARFGRSTLHPEFNPTRFAFSPDGTQILAGCNGVCVLDATTGAIVRQFAIK